MFSRLSAIALAAVALQGCNTFNQGPVEDPGLGEAVKYNAAIQTIDPDPIYDETGAQPGDSGDKGAEAVERYRTDKVKQVEQIRTSTVGSGSGPQ